MVQRLDARLARGLLEDGALAGVGAGAFQLGARTRAHAVRAASAAPAISWEIDAPVSEQQPAEQHERRTRGARRRREKSVEVAQ